MFTVTSEAARQIRDAAQAAGAEGAALRVAARRDADGSIQYGMGFDDEHDSDTQIVVEGITVVIAQQLEHLLATTVLDFVELNPGEFNFIFINADETAMPAPSRAGHAGASHAGTGCSSGGGGGCGGGGCGGGGGGCH